LVTDTSWSGAIAGTVHRSYDNFFRVASESVSGGPATSYQYDADGLLIAAGALQIQRDPATGFVTGSALGGITESRTYDAYGGEATDASSFSGSSLYGVSYTRDATGRISSKTERVGSEAAHTFSYGYDLAGRLIDVLKDGVLISRYAYDSNGNRTAGPGLTSSPVYDAQDRLTSYGACTHTYKADGSLQTKTCPGGTTTYDYDAFGNLRHATLPNATQIEYVVDGEDRRIGKKVNGLLVEGFLYRDPLKPAVWLNTDGSVRGQFVYGSRPNVPEHMVKGTSTYRLIADQVGSVRLVVDTSNGAIVERIDYDEFGNVLTDTAPGTIPFGFAGGLRDRDTGLTRFGARDYDPVIGRWTTKDPLRFDGGLSNLYSYVGSDPVNHADASGLDQTIIDWSGPRNGNWGGKNWSGGWDPRKHGGQDGPAPPLDSGDECYMAHDKCYETPGCSSKNKSDRKMAIRRCDLELVTCLAKLPLRGGARRPPRSVTARRGPSTPALSFG
jgi:RHS repeat-associated protein